MQDGCLVEDYIDAVDFRAMGEPPPADKWVDAFRFAAGRASFFNAPIG